MKTKSFFSALLGLAAIVSLASCQSTASSGGPTEAVMCPKCQMVAYERPGTINKQLVILTGKTMACEECKSEAKNYFSKHVSLTHKCAHCGTTLVHCTAH